MKLAEKIIKLGLAIAAVAGIAYLVVTYIDTIKAWLAKVCPCCAADDAEEVVVTEETEEAPAAQTEEKPEEVIVEETTPVAEETDFEE